MLSSLASSVGSMNILSRFDRKTVATVLAIAPGFLGIFGLGHIYLGAKRRGIAILVIGVGFAMIAYPGYVSFQYATGISSGAVTTTMIIVIALVMSGLAAVGVWVWQILDARKIAKQQEVEA